jgi:hypothetical protein
MMKPSLLESSLYRTPRHLSATERDESRLRAKQEAASR